MLAEHFSVGQSASLADKMGFDTVLYEGAVYRAAFPANSPRYGLGIDGWYLDCSLNDSPLSVPPSAIGPFPNGRARVQ